MYYKKINENNSYLLKTKHLLVENNSYLKKHI
jgi:hypothetical protein